MRQLQRTLWTGAAAAALTLGTAQAGTTTPTVAVDDPYVMVYEPMATSAAVDDVVSDQKLPLWAKVTALGAFFGGLAGLIGLKRLGKVAAAGTLATARVARTAAKVPLKAAAAGARYVGRSLKTPIRWVLAALGLSLFLSTGIVMMDFQWEAGLAIGSLIGAGGVYLFGKMRRKPVPVRINNDAPEQTPPRSS